MAGAFCTTFSRKLLAAVEMSCPRRKGGSWIRHHLALLQLPASVRTVAAAAAEFSFLATGALKITFVPQKKSKSCVSLTHHGGSTDGAF